jgi:uncharacterized protein (TIGR02271 family)
MATLTYLDQPDDGTPELPVGYLCLDASGEQLGDVAGVLVDQGAREPRFLVVATGNWLTQRHYVVPCDQITARDDAQRTLALGGVAKDSFKNGRFPEYNADWQMREGINGGSASAGADQRLELREEVLRASAEPYLAGRVRIGKRVVEREETLTVPLREEVLVIEHTGGDSSIRVGDRELAPGEALEMVIYKERIIVQKEVERREAVTIRKEKLQRSEQVRSILRREELEVREGAEFLRDAGAPGSESGHARKGTPSVEQPGPLPKQARTRQR